MCFLENEGGGAVRGVPGCRCSCKAVHVPYVALYEAKGSYADALQLELVFPLVVACHFQIEGSSGTR